MSLPSESLKVAFRQYKTDRGKVPRLANREWYPAPSANEILGSDERQGFASDLRGHTWVVGNTGNEVVGKPERFSRPTGPLAVRCRSRSSPASSTPPRCARGLRGAPLGRDAPKRCARDSPKRCRGLAPR